MAATFPPRVHRAVLLLAGVALAALVASMLALARAPPPATWVTLAGAVAFLGAYGLLEANAVTFVWRGHRHTAALTEAVIVVGFVVLTPPLVVVLAPLVRAVLHFAARRPPVKGLFNVAQQALALATGSGLTLALLAMGAHPLVAALAGTVLYVLVADLLMAGLFAIIERANPFRVYAQRLLPTNALGIAAGLPGGVVLYALHELHPLATLVAFPLFGLLVRASSLAAGSDRELDVRRRLAEDARSLVGIQDEELIAMHVVDASRELLDAGRVRLWMADGREWEQSGPDASEGRPITAALTGRDGRELGGLEAWERRTKRRYAEEERALLQVLAGQAAHAFESADALAQVAAQRDVITKQEKLSSLGTLLAGVAHEVNNPLSYMRLRLQVTRTEAQKVIDDPSAPAASQALARKMIENVDTLAKGVERLAGLSHSLKVVARPGDGLRRATDLNEVVSQVMTLLRAAEKSVTYETRLADGLPAVQANAAELHQVVLNLVKNAAEVLADTEGALIRVETRCEGTEALILVADNGPGIPSHAQAQLFTPFFTTKEKGTGLGLSISHQIVAAHGGALTFQTSPAGTTFIVRLPLASPALVP